MFLVWPFLLPEVCPSSDLTLLLGTVLLLGMGSARGFIMSTHHWGLVLGLVEVVAVVKADFWMM